MVETIKMVVVGDFSAHKTQLLFNYTNSDCTNEFPPTIFENYCRNIDVDNKTLKIQLFDTTGQENYKYLRTTSYGQADIFILCYSLNDKISLSNVKNIWFPEIKHTRPKSKIILVGTTLDYSGKVLTTENGEKMKQLINADDYIECNLFEKTQINSVFESAAKVVLNKKSKRKGKLNIFSKFMKKKKEYKP